MSEATLSLAELPSGKLAIVVAIHDNEAALGVKLREAGFAEGDQVELVHKAPFGGGTLCVRLNHTLMALRPEEAALVEISPASQAGRP